MHLGDLSENQLKHWRLLYEESLSDAQSVNYFKELDGQRLIDQREMVELLNSYLADQVSTEELRATFDRKTRKDWNTFGFKGMSGAMFLNMLVKHVSDERTLSDQLRFALSAPKDAQDGRERMQTFMRFLESLISSHQASKRQIQPARTPFFLSGWWHLQATEQWPIFYPLTRQMFELEGLYIASQNPVEDYFSFRERFLSLAMALGLTTWQLEHLCAWYRGRKNKDVGIASKINSNVVIEPVHTDNGHKIIIEDDEGESQPSARSVLPNTSQQESEDEQIISGHIHTQWLLAKIGRKLGCEIWIAANDQNKIWNGERLGDLSLKRFPNLWMDSEFQQIISLIDVLWLKGPNVVAAAFEVEHTTSIYSGLLRMSDLIALYPNINFPLYIVTPDARLDKVRRELSRPTFQALELHKRCGFFSEERLLQEAEFIMRWATNPSAIEKLASKVDDVDG